MDDRARTLITTQLPRRLTRRALTGALAGGAALLAIGPRRRALGQDATPGAVSLDDDAFNQVVVATTVETGNFPLDATPDPDGTTFFFTAAGTDGPAVYRVPALGGAVVTVAGGAPFVTPRGVAVSTDGRTLYVADPAAASSGAGGLVFALSVDGGDPVPVPGSEGTLARAVEIAAEASGDHLVLAGVDPATGQPAVLTLAASGAPTPTILAHGAPLVAPDGVAVSHSGAIYVADRGPAAESTGGRVYRVLDGRVEAIFADFQAGNPAGIALIIGESILAISAVDPAAGAAQVLLVDLATGQTGVATKRIGDNPGAGGLHRGRNTETLAWVSAPMGPIYKIMAGRASEN